jgi:hypothetical protein
MLSLLSKLSQSRRLQAIPQPASRAASVETLEDRRLYSVSSGGDVASFSWGESNSGATSATLDKASPKLMTVEQSGDTVVSAKYVDKASPELLLVEQPGDTNIIAVLIAL